MLVIRLREQGDRLRIGDVLIEYRLRSSGQVEISIDAPADILVMREERSRNEPVERARGQLDPTSRLWSK